jgi:hypothetical protein
MLIIRGIYILSGNSIVKTIKFMIPTNYSRHEKK